MTWTSRVWCHGTLPRNQISTRQSGVIGQWLDHARRGNRARLWVMGAHVIRAGVVPHLIDLMDSGHITGIALNGAGPIHDWEFALIGASTESVARYIRTGEFGLWTETGRINGVVKKAAREGIRHR